MALRQSFEFENVDVWLRKISKLRKGRELRKIIRQTLRSAARPVLATAKAFVPEDTGALRRSLKIRAAKKSRRGIGVVVRPGSRKELGIKADAPGYYPAHIELGTKYVPESAYLRDAFDAKSDQALETIIQGVGRGIREIVIAG